ncbi:Acg family FMN-binding oxidoreductase [Amycolatopsis benzoatilytica]|uniref:Acg family FMN-binding oxidoreductase n=1 Tax=Amycolatopsis benzoatilytica TaxID=346045 RepID=UPI00037407B4|nr:nitroreductase family protein [Amycolatopsis benzoatilytica]
MTLHVAPAGQLSTDQVASALRAATLAPSTHNTQPWLFASGPDGIELYADADRTLPVVDADRRELLLSCGAALFNLRTAIHAMGVHPATSLMPRRDDPDLLALVLPQATAPIDRRLAVLATAIPKRHTNRTPFAAEPVPAAAIGRLRHAAEVEHAWMPQLDAGQVAGLRDLVRKSHRVQMADPAFVAEWQRWTGRGQGNRDGVPFAAGGTVAADDTWVLRDYGTSSRAPSAGPLVVVIGTFGDTPTDRLRAGQAMQRVLLTATAEGIDASFVSQPVEVPAVRAQLRDLLGGGLWPQIVLRLGYGSPVSWTPRRTLDDVLVEPSPLIA